MNRLTLVFAILICCVISSASDSPNPARILGIAYVRVFVTDLDMATDFYSLILRSISPSYQSQAPCDWCERAPISMGMEKKRLGPIELQVLHAKDTHNLLSEVAFITDDVKGLRSYLLKNQIPAEKLTKCGENSCFSVFDPEHHRLVFVQKSPSPLVEIPGAYSSVPGASPIIHAGFVVRDRAVEDHFYKDILGFHLYWQGGMKDGEKSWVAMQVPDGTAWVEYMLNIAPDADHHTLGVMNHIAIGVPDIHAAEQALIKNGWKPGEKPKMGRDGKWQLNLYDPDDTRVEFMEFRPVEKPCCSEFTGPHPGPHL